MNRHLIFPTLRWIGPVVALSALIAAPRSAAQEPFGTAATASQVSAALPWEPSVAPQRQKNKHTHKYVRRSIKEWVPPEYRRVKVGVDKNGKPIYERRLIRPGHHRTITVQVCSVCGRRRR